MGRIASKGEVKLRTADSLFLQLILNDTRFSMKLFPESAFVQLEFNKIRELLANYCETEMATIKANELRIHTKKEFVETELRQSHEYRQLVINGIYFPNDFIQNLSKELKLLSIPGAVLSSEELNHIRKLAAVIENIFRWFDNEKKVAYSGLLQIISNTYYEKAIPELINEVLDENSQVKDNASEDLKNIRIGLYRKRNELRRLFDKIVSKLNKQGYLAEIEESFMSGRRVLAVFAEQQRTVKGSLHGESANVRVNDQRRKRPQVVQFDRIGVFQTRQIRSIKETTSSMDSDETDEQQSENVRKADHWQVVFIPQRPNETIKKTMTQCTQIFEARKN